METNHFQTYDLLFNSKNNLSKLNEDVKWCIKDDLIQFYSRSRINENLELMYGTSNRNKFLEELEKFKPSLVAHRQAEMEELLAAETERLRLGESKVSGYVFLGLTIAGSVGLILWKGFWKVGTEGIIL